MTRIFGNVPEEDGFRLLIPESELRLACTLEVGKDLIVVEAETYAGLSITGEARVIDRVASTLERLSPGLLRT